MEGLKALCSQKQIKESNEPKRAKVKFKQADLNSFSGSVTRMKSQFSFRFEI